MWYDYIYERRLFILVFVVVIDHERVLLLYISNRLIKNK